MRLFPTAAVLAAGALLSACASMGGGDAAAPAASFDVARLSEHVRVLADDSFQGRGIATPAEEMTVRYLSEQYAAAGFEPGGVNGSWTQDVALNRFTASNFRGVQLKAGGETIPLTQGQEITISTRLPGNHVMISGIGMTSRTSTCAARSSSCWSMTPTSRSRR
jgi:hypothetical protein